MSPYCIVLYCIVEASWTGSPPEFMLYYILDDGVGTLNDSHTPCPPAKSVTLGAAQLARFTSLVVVYILRSWGHKKYFVYLFLFHRVAAIPLPGLLPALLTKLPSATIREIRLPVENQGCIVSVKASTSSFLLEHAIRGLKWIVLRCPCIWHISLCQVPFGLVASLRAIWLLTYHISSVREASE